MKQIIPFIFSILILLLFSGCKQVVDTTETEQDLIPPTVSENEEEPEVTEPETEPESTVKEFDIVAKKWTFDPELIIVDRGDTVILHITSVDVSHGFKLPVFGVYENLEPGETIDVEFIPDKMGEFLYSCSVYCGSGHDTMKGKFIVR